MLDLSYLLIVKPNNISIATYNIAYFQNVSSWLEHDSNPFFFWQTLLNSQKIMLSINIVSQNHTQNKDGTKLSFKSTNRINDFSHTLSIILNC